MLALGRQHVIDLGNVDKMISESFECGHFLNGLLGGVDGLYGKPEREIPRI